MSLPTQQQIEKLMQYKEADAEADFHHLYDCLVEEKLRELDPEFISALDALSKGMRFHYS